MDFLFWIIFSVATIIPMLKLLPFFGIDKRWAFACLLPLATLALIWWMALKLQELEKR